MKASVRYLATSPSMFVANVGSEHGLLIQAPPGGDTQSAQVSPSPLETMLSGAAACSAYDIIQLARERSVRIVTLSVAVEAERATTPPKVFTKIHFVYEARKSELSESDLLEVIKASHEHHCSAIGMLKSTARISFEIRMVP